MAVDVNKPVTKSFLNTEICYPLVTSPGSKGEDCADLSTSMKFGTDVDQNMLNSFLRAPKPAPIGPPYLPNPRWPLADI